MNSQLASVLSKPVIPIAFLSRFDCGQLAGDAITPTLVSTDAPNPNRPHPLHPYHKLTE